MHPFGIARSIFQCSRRPWPLLLCLLFWTVAGTALGQGDPVQADVRTRAEAAYAAGDLLGALPDYERLVSLFPEEACLHGRLAGCALKEPGRLSLVRRHLRIALRKGCNDLDLGFHQARLAQLEYDFERARDLYAAYLMAAGKKGRFTTEAQIGALACEKADWRPAEAVSLEVFERIPSAPDAAFRYYDPEVEGLRLVATPTSLRSKADLKSGQGRMALHDGDTVLVYASLGKKGARGWDLYRVSIRNGAYTEPVLLEGTINSEYDEKDAYLSKEGVLYYASNCPGGLGGFDIYAVTCGVDGLPTGQPYRLPYPINSVNDDVFFIPEAAGGAWMASNRAAVEGKVHAYRIGLGEGEMATGSIAWSADEVEGEGFKLRVFSGGEEVSFGDLNGDAAAHLSFSGDESVRIVLEDAAGNVLAESFGAGEGAWELKKTSSGWDLEDKSEVLADWAVLSDLQVGAGTGSSQGGVAGTETSGEDSDGATAQGMGGWADWMASRNSEAAVPAADVASVASTSMDSSLDSDVNLAGSPGAQDALSPGPELVDLAPAKPAGVDGSDLEAADTASTEAEASESESIGLEATEVESTEAKVTEPVDVADVAVPSDVQEPEGGPAFAQEPEAEDDTSADSDNPVSASDPWASDRVEVLAAQVPEDPEIVAQLLASKPETVVEVWEERAEQILVLEQGFLDDPDFNKAGELYDLLDQMDAWRPQVEMMSPLLQDGVAMNDMRDMLDEWSFAVQSASKASLAKVAGEAALALRRDRLAIRELWGASDMDLTPLKVRWSNWRDANRGIPGVPPEDAVMLPEDGTLLLDQWESVLEVSDETWNRKERSGWRGDWLDRQQVELTLNREFWDGEMAAIEAATEVVPDAVPVLADADMAVVESTQVQSEEGDSAIKASPSTEATTVAKEQGPLIDVAGEAEVALVAQLLPGMSVGSDSNVDSAALEVNFADWSDQWDSAVAESKDVARQWERLARASDGEGVAPVSDGAGLMGLTPAVRSAYSGLVVSVMAELLALRSDWERERAPLLAQWEEKEFAGMGNSEPVAQARELWAVAQRAEEAIEDVEGRKMSGEAAEFDRAIMQREALAQAETAWRAWAAAWSAVLESEMQGEEIAASQKEATVLDQGLSEEELEVVRGDVADGMAPTPAEEATSEPGEMDVAVDAPQSVDLAAEGTAAGTSEDVAKEALAEVDAVVVDLETTASEVAIASSVEAEGADSGVGTLDLSEVLENSSKERLERVASAMMATKTAQQSGLPLDLDAKEREALSAWLERIDIEGNDPGTSAGRAARMAWDKRMFFNERRLRAALNALDLDTLERKLSGEIQDEEVDEAEVSVSEFEETRAEGGDLSSITAGSEEPTVENAALPDVGLPAEAAAAEAVSSASELENAEANVEAPTRPIPGVVEAEAVARQDEDVASYGLVLPEAEVWGSSTNRGRSGGLTLRPIDRAAMEKSIMARPFAADSEEEASERFGSERGAPLAEGVEYKIQIGAFRKALPAALFAAFDPMWAQKLANGITRYMAGSFDLYDPAVAARDAIRALGYADAFVVRFVDGERVRASRPEPELLAEERASVVGRDVLAPRPVGAAMAEASGPAVDGSSSNASNAGAGAGALPTRREDIPTWDGVAGRVYSVQVGAFRGVPDAEAMAALGTLTREDAGSDGWLRLFSGRFATQAEAEAHRSELKGQGRNDAFIVVYINGRRIPLAQASVTSVASLPGAQNPGLSQSEIDPEVQAEEEVEEAPLNQALIEEAWCVELGVFNSTIPVRLANAILDAPLQWQIRSVRSDGLTRYRTAFVSEAQARNWLNAAQVQGFSNAQLVRE